MARVAAVCVMGDALRDKKRSFRGLARRTALVASVFVFALLGLGIAGRWPSRTATIAAAVGLLMLYGGAFSVGAGMLRRATAFGYETWLANAVFAAIGLGLVASRALTIPMEPGR